MSATLTERTTAYREAAARVNEIERSGRPETERLAEITEVLKDLSRKPDLIPVEAFPRAPGTAGGLFHLAQAPDGKGGLYVSLGFTGRGGGSPHTHASWAVVVGVSGGIETNWVYRRIDDGAVDGEAELELVSEVDVGPGEAIILPTGAFHTIAVESDTPVLHLHAYGVAVETPGITLPAFENPQSRTYSLRTTGGFQPPLPSLHLAEARREAAAGRLAVLVLEAGFTGFAGPSVVAATPERAAAALAGVDRNLPVAVAAAPAVALKVGADLYADGRAVVFQLAPQAVAVAA